MIELARMQVRLMATEKNGEAIFVVIDETPYEQWNILVIHSTDWYGRTFPPGFRGPWDTEWLRTNTVVIA